MADDVPLEVFKAFVCTKAFDIIGNGTYKAYLVKARDNGDEWAMRMHASTTTVVEHVKAINALVAQIRKFSAAGLGAICKEITSNTTPPVFSARQWNVCQISGQHSECCVELLRSQHKQSRAVFVHAQYTRFLELLWFACKIEHVVRNYTRQWLRQRDGEQQELSLWDTCNAFKDDDADVCKFHVAFRYACAYVRASLAGYLQHMQHSTALTLAH